MSTVLGSSAPPVTVKLVRAFSSGSKDASIIASQVSHNFLFFFSCLLGRCSLSIIRLFWISSSDKLSASMAFGSLVHCFLMCLM